MLITGAAVGAFGIALFYCDWVRCGALAASTGCVLIGLSSHSDWVQAFAWIWALAITGVAALGEVEYRREYKRGKEEEKANGSEEFHA